MPIRKTKTKKKTSSKKMQRGSIGSFFVFGVLAVLIVGGITAVGGLPPDSYPQNGQTVIAITPTPDADHSTLQLKTFGYVTIAPTPPIANNSLCKNPSVNTEAQILEAYSPLPGSTVSTNGQIKVWVVDEAPPIVAPGLTTNADGSVNSPGDQSALAPDGYLWDPALYVDTPVEQGGHPFFPDFVKGVYDPTPPNCGSYSYSCFQNVKGVNGADADPIPAGSQPISSNQNGPTPNTYLAEYIWNVSKLGLSSGTHQAEFLIHDGDRDRGVGCVTINIQ